jgi:chromosome segregation ATPase
VSDLSKQPNPKEEDSESIKESLDDVVHRLEQDPASSKSWASAMSKNRERWEEIKKQIQSRQKALKNLVRDKKAGSIGQDEFDKKFRVLQDELTELEFEVYNLRLGTHVKG